jgi:polyphosphate kinase
MFETLKRRDVLLVHPYESFDPVVRLVEEAARDPDVLAIKQILYRTSPDSPVIAALLAAAERGKHVTAVVELKARFDEARNIEWAKELETAGAQVIYGVKGLKTHAKLCIVVRREAQGVARYLHFGTGNYNEKTARVYSDIGLMTRDPDLGADASAFFNAVTGYSVPSGYVKIAAAPLGLRERIMELIESESERSRQGQKGLIRIKVNSLVCPRIIRALYGASQAGVKVQLNVRGICCLRPGARGLSENISVTSIVDRFLEHSRVYHFSQGGEERVFISSADLMPRNLDRRVELLVPVEDSACRKRLLAVLDAYFRDTEKSRDLMPDGRYCRRRAAGRRRAFRCQEAMCRAAEANVRAAESASRTMLEPLLPAGMDRR